MAGALGRIAAPGRGRLVFGADDIRLSLATRLFRAAGEAREAADRGDVRLAAEALRADVWSEAWDATLEAVGRLLAERMQAEMARAATESRMPRRILGRRLPTEDEVRAMTARLGAGTAKFHEALKKLAAAAQDVAGRDDDAAGERWTQAVETAGRRLEAAWIALEAVAQAEMAHWQPEVAAVRHWSRPRWPLWLITILVMLIATYFGLLIGGYIEAPAGLEWVVGLF